MLSEDDIRLAFLTGLEERAIALGYKTVKQADEKFSSRLSIFRTDWLFFVTYAVWYDEGVFHVGGQVFEVSPDGPQWSLAKSIVVEVPDPGSFDEVLVWGSGLVAQSVQQRSCKTPFPSSNLGETS